jgi:hypothetical protein
MDIGDRHLKVANDGVNHATQVAAAALLGAGILLLLPQVVMHPVKFLGVYGSALPLNCCSL